MGNPEEPLGNTTDLFHRLRSFLLPGGADAVRLVRRVRLTERGEMRSAPNARWIPFTAETMLGTQRSEFTWEARFRAGKVVPLLVTDAYEEGRGRLVVKVAGALPVVNARGPDLDKGELQRYLASVSLCPLMVLANHSLEWRAAGARTLRVRDTQGPAGTHVDIDLGEDGRPIAGRAERPRAVGRQTVLTPWRTASIDFREWGGLRVCVRAEAAWELPEGLFTYYRAEVTALRSEE